MGRARSSSCVSPIHQAAHIADLKLQTQKDFPSQLLSATGPLDASLVVASFGSSKPYHSKAFDITFNIDTLPPSEKPLRYGKLPEIHHIFKSDPKSPPKIITIVFAAAVIAGLPVLLGSVSTTITTPTSPTNRFLRSGSHSAQI